MVCQLVERCDGYGGWKGVLEGVITSRRCDTPQGGVKDGRKVCQLMERCDGYGGCKGCWKV